MLTNVARRLLNMVVTLFGVSVIVFLVLRILPGNAVTAQMGVSAGLLSQIDRVVCPLAATGTPAYPSYPS